VTLSPSEQALYNRVLDFVSSETRTRKHLSGSTDIAKDLGVDGDDATEFMLKFRREFDVDLSSFRFDRYFGGEGFRLILAIKSLLGKGDVRDPLTVTLLFNAALQRCQAPPLARERGGVRCTLFLARPRACPGAPGIRHCAGMIGVAGT
jgi:hypothetical protein